MMSLKNKITLIILVFFFFNSLKEATLYAQENSNFATDSVVSRVKTIRYSDISVRAAETLIQNNRLKQSLIKDSDIDILKERNDSITNFLDSLLKADLSTKPSQKNIRSLNNRIVFWNLLTQNLKTEKDQLLSINESIDEEIVHLDDELILWQNTKISLVSSSKGQNLIITIDDVILELKNLQDLLLSKSDKLIRMINKSSEVEIHIVEYRDQIDKALIAKTTNVLDSQQQSIFSFEFRDKSIWRIFEPLKVFYYLEVKQLVSYLNQSIPNIILLFAIFISLIILFTKIRPYVRDIDKSNSIYLKKLSSFYSRNISMAIILTLFLSILIFPNRPELFKNISRLIVVIPLILIFRQIIESRFYWYLYLLMLLLVVQLASFVFPPSHIVYRGALMLTSFLQIIAFWGLLSYFYKYQFKKAIYRNLSLLILFIHLLFSIIGFVSTITGTTRLAELTINASISNALTAIILVITIVIVNSLIQLVLEGATMRKLNFVKLYEKPIIQKSIQLINLAAVLLWIQTMLGILTIDSIVVNGIRDFFSKQLSLGVITFSLGGIFVFCFVIWLSIFISKVVNILLEKDVLNRLKLAKGVPHTIAILVRYILITLGFILAIGAAGFPMQNFTILFGAFGVGIGFGLQNIFNNLVSGLILLFERPIQIGDTIEVGELIGNVKAIGLRSSNVRTFDGAEVIVPNGQLISNEVINWTLSDQLRRIEVLAGVSYNSNPHDVREVLFSVLEGHPDIIKYPEPKVYFKSMGESSLDFRLLFWTSNIGEWLRIQSEITFMVFDSLKNAGIEIPFPQRDLHIRSVDDSIHFNKNEADDDESKTTIE